MYQRISVAKANQLIEDQKPLIFDIRDTASFQAAHLPDAVYLSDQTLKRTLKHTPRSRVIIVYCYHGNASQDMAKLLADFGFAEVYSVDGGFEAWRQTLPITVAAPPATAAAPETNLAAWLKAQGFGENLEASFHGVTPLIKASQMGLSEVVEELLAAGAQLTSVDAYGNDALWAACFSGDLPTLDVLIRAGIALDRQNPSGNTSLIHAASAGKTAVVECLLQAGADPHIENQDGYSALELAANLPVLKLLRGLGQKTVDSAPPPPAHAPSGDGLRL